VSARPGLRAQFDSSVVWKETHQVLGPNKRWYKSEDEADRYREHRNVRVRAARAGFDTTAEGIEEYRRWEAGLPRHTKKVDKLEQIRQLLDQDLTMAEFATEVINIIEDRK
jgi:hypothetical protein